MNIENAVKNLEKRGFHAVCFENRDEAREYLVKKLHGRTIGFGGSVTAITEMGLYEALGKDNEVWSHWKTDRAEALAHAAEADVYITSANAVAETGEIINIDGSGNRIAATLDGKREVYFVVGVNKFAESFDQALWRARNIAAPKNARRLGVKTPCAAKGDRCYDCDSPARICRGITVLWGKMMSVEKCEVVIINEELGY